jgi:hypothetical protein
MAEGWGDVHELIREMLLIGSIGRASGSCGLWTKFANEILRQFLFEFLHRPSIARECGFRYSALSLKAVSKGRDDLSTVPKR